MTIYKNVKMRFAFTLIALLFLYVPFITSLADQFSNQIQEQYNTTKSHKPNNPMDIPRSSIDAARYTCVQAYTHYDPKEQEGKNTWVPLCEAIASEAGASASERSFYMSFFVGILLLGNLWLGQKDSETGKIAADHARRSAEASEFTTRAWVQIVEEHKARFAFDADPWNGGRATICIKCKNLGATPAINHHVTAKVVKLNDVSESYNIITEALDEVLVERESIFPKSRRRYLIDIEIPGFYISPNNIDNIGILIVSKYSIISGLGTDEIKKTPELFKIQFPVSQFVVKNGVLHLSNLVNCTLRLERVSCPDLIPT